MRQLHLLRSEATGSHGLFPLSSFHPVTLLYYKTDEPRVSNPYRAYLLILQCPLTTHSGA